MIRMKNYLFNTLMMVILGAFFVHMSEVHHYTLHRKEHAQPELGRVIPIVGNYNKTIFVSKGDLWLIYSNYIVGGVAVSALFLSIFFGFIDMKKV